MADVFKLMTQTSVLDLLRQSAGAPSDADLYALIMASIERIDHSFGTLVASRDKETLPVVAPSHIYGGATMKSRGPQRSMDPGAAGRGETRLAIKVKPWELFATEGVLEERDWNAMLLPLKNALGRERLVAAVELIAQSAEMKEAIGPQRFKKATLLSALGDETWASVPTGGSG